ncbi:oxidoreductase [Microlunatus flavus]|uniref:NAD(P)-dependent dehydrogenase, short-chain alcohol dehydrogenase family n=1 Tax=Microlunatus flavus TaxID=1036181 RepID=A0A1H9C864_9ACTN|nr:oxidoreductase [Microlunatus flavus]SEP97396.1 NAD(P)-dependent dehydrogenase, short-chain alcohol dehydrogenase family [Microlunatus flavus]
MSTASGWTENDIPDLTGLRAVVTGANSGLGLQTALQLARHGAWTTLACRSEERGRAAVEQVRSQLGDGPGTADLAILDLADLSSVRRFAEDWHGPLDVLVNNAGVMAVPYDRTVDGFERQLGTNHLGHFALTGLLLPALRQARAARVVNVSSLGHRMGRIDFDDLQSERHYQRWLAYGQSKLANLLFTRELVRRLNRAGSTVAAAAAHPGGSDTELYTGFAGSSGPFARVSKLASQLTGQPASAGALPSLYAATMPDVVPGDYFGPSGVGEVRGTPTRVGMSARARDAVVGERLWDVSEELTDVTYDLPR